MRRISMFHDKSLITGRGNKSGPIIQSAKLKFSKPGKMEEYKGSHYFYQGQLEKTDKIQKSTVQRH